MATVRGVTASQIRDGSMLAVSGRQSTNDGRRAAVADGLGGGDEGIDRDDDFVAGPDTGGLERQAHRVRTRC